jgi:hypothetical protein
MISTTEAIKAYPLTWPTNWPRTPTHDRLSGSRYKVGANKARRELIDELRKLGAEDIVLSSNTELRTDGMPYADASRRAQRDPGIAVYFAMDGKPCSMARDVYAKLDDNLRMLGLAVRDMRSLQLHGGDFMMKAAFTGFAALPPADDCWFVLGVASRKDKLKRDDIMSAFRETARTLNEVGGDMGRLVKARDEALRLIGAT